MIRRTLEEELVAYWGDIGHGQGGPPPARNYRTVAAGDIDPIERKTLIALNDKYPRVSFFGVAFGRLSAATRKKGSSLYGKGITFLVSVEELLKEDMRAQLLEEE